MAVVARLPGMGVMARVATGLAGLQNGPRDGGVPEWPPGWRDSGMATEVGGEWNGRRDGGIAEWPVW